MARALRSGRRGRWFESSHPDSQTPLPLPKSAVVGKSGTRGNVGATKSGDPGPHEGASASLPPGLARVVDAWAELPAAAKAGILAMVDAAQQDRGGEA